MSEMERGRARWGELFSLTHDQRLDCWRRWNFQALGFVSIRNKFSTQLKWFSLDLIAFPFYWDPNVWELMKVWKYTQLIFNHPIEERIERKEGCTEVGGGGKNWKIFGFAPEIDSIYCKREEENVRKMEVYVGVRKNNNIYGTHSITQCSLLCSLNCTINTNIKIVLLARPPLLFVCAIILLNFFSL
jgi:hypothetical protein